MTTARRHEEDALQIVDPLERRLTQALEAVPHVVIADDFAARLMAQVPTRRTLSYSVPTRASVGRRISVIALALLFVAMFIFALQAGRMNAAVRDAAIWAITAEFIILTVWVSLRPSQSF